MLGVRRSALGVPFFYPLDILPHRDRAIDLFPARPFPKRPAFKIIISHQDQRSLQAGLAKTIETFVDQAFAKTGSLTIRIDRKMIDVPAPAIVTAHRHANNFRSIERDAT